MQGMLFRRVARLTTAALVVATACGESSTAPGGESEVISRVTLTLTPSTGGSALVTYIDDSDGNGPTAPAAQVTPPALVKGVTYTGTAEVQAEANTHRVFYTVTGTGVTLTTTDVDSQNRPLGVRFTKAVAATATAGSVRVVLCHYDAKPKVATATSCDGETDINLVFNYTIAP